MIYNLLILFSEHGNASPACSSRFMRRAELSRSHERAREQETPAQSHSRMAAIEYRQQLVHEASGINVCEPAVAFLHTRYATINLRQITT